MKKVMIKIKQKTLCALLMCAFVSTGVLYAEEMGREASNEEVRSKALVLVEEIGTLLKNIEQGDVFIDSLSPEEKGELVVSLERILERAVREDQLSATSPLNPVPWFDSSDIDEIRRCVCIIKRYLGRPDVMVDPDATCDTLTTVFELLIWLCENLMDTESKVCLIELTVNETLESVRDTLDKVCDIELTVNETLDHVFDIESTVNETLDKIGTFGQVMEQSILDDITDNVTLSDDIAAYDLTVCQLLQAILMKVK